MVKRASALSWAVIVTAHLLQAYVIYLLFYPVSVFTLMDEPQMVGQPYSAGTEAVYYRMNYCKENDDSAVISREYLTTDRDGVLIVAQLPSTSSHLDAGCHAVVIAVDVPTSLPDGEYRLRIERTWQINPLRRYSAVFVTEPFVLNRGVEVVSSMMTRGPGR